MSHHGREGYRKPTEVVSKQDESTVVSTGTKNDAGKPKVSLIPEEAILEMARGFTYGAGKYSSDNFKGGLKYRRLLDASFRHLFSIASGEFTDAESGNSHLSHALCSLAMLAWMMEHRPDLNDIYPNKKV